MALVEFLKRKPLEMPRVVETATEPERGQGTVTVNFPAGDLILEDDEGQAYRLSWTADEARGERARSVPAGVYRLRTYRILREEDGESWHISGTAPTIKKITVHAGRTAKVEIDQRITLKSRMGKGRVSAGIGGEKGAGLTIYRGQRRIDMGYRIKNRRGKQVAAGSMRYG